MPWGEHEYVVSSNTKFDTAEHAKKALHAKPAPGSYPDGVHHGLKATLPWFGTVEHLVNPATGTVWNVTETRNLPADGRKHRLDPGYVKREVVPTTDGRYEIRTTGRGYGMPGRYANKLGAYMWPYVFGP
jgi:hypothetical protein